MDNIWTLDIARNIFQFIIHKKPNIATPCIDSNLHCKYTVHTALHVHLTLLPVKSTVFHHICQSTVIRVQQTVTKSDVQLTLSQRVQQNRYVLFKTPGPVELPCIGVCTVVVKSAFQEFNRRKYSRRWSNTRVL